MGKKSHQNKSYVNRQSAPALPSARRRTRAGLPEAVVAGESARSIMDAVVQGNRDIQDDGSLQVSLCLPNDEAAPLMRAIMRIEAEFLVADADELDIDRLLRTPDQRRADAFVAVVQRASAALCPEETVDGTVNSG